MEVVELKPWLYVNGLLVRTKEALQIVTDFYSKKGEEIKIEPVKMENGRYVCSVIDPMET